MGIWCRTQQFWNPWWNILRSDVQLRCTFWSFQMSFIQIDYSVDFKGRELWNPLTMAVPGKFNRSGGHSKNNYLRDRANLHRCCRGIIVLNVSVYIDRNDMNSFSFSTICYSGTLFFRMFNLMDSNDYVLEKSALIIQWNLYNETGEVLLKHKFCHLPDTVFIQSCLFSLPWKATCFERPQSSAVDLYRFHGYSCNP